LSVRCCGVINDVVIFECEGEKDGKEVLDRKDATMRAISLSQFGDPDVMRIADVPEPDLRPTDLLVRVHAAGVDRADLRHRRGGYGQADFGDSEIMGLEISGEVIRLGADARGFNLGDRVMGDVGGGGYAQVARIDYRIAMPVPEGLDFIHSAAVPEAYVTAHESLFHLGRLEASESVLIHAASGVGSAAVQMAHAAGARVFATASAAKVEHVRRLGADIVVDYKTQDFAESVAAATAGRGVDVVVDFVGPPYFERNVRSLVDGGRLIQVGLMGGGETVPVPLGRLVLGHLQIFGTIMKSRSQPAKQAMVSRFNERWRGKFGAGGLLPVIDSVFPLADAAEAHRRMEANLNAGKIVLLPPQEQPLHDA
jgi:NADPH2:quinone reductase